jgi:D-tyrosyl-tRNA(Tyr) deacylase
VRVVLQRVTRASVTIEGRIAGAIDRGFCLLVGFTHSDTPAEVDWMARRSRASAFQRSQDKMNLGLDEVGGRILVISSSRSTATLRRAAGRHSSTPPGPEVAIPLYERFVAALRAKGLKVETGEFGAMMQVEIHNDGPSHDS